MTIGTVKAEVWKGMQIEEHTLRVLSNPDPEQAIVIAPSNPHPIFTQVILPRSAALGLCGLIKAALEDR